jgi:hypothetical protein
MPKSAAAAQAAHTQRQHKKDGQLKRAEIVEQGERAVGWRPVERFKHLEHRSWNAEHPRKPIARNSNRSIAGNSNRRGGWYGLWWGWGGFTSRGRSV